ncbi:unnamed protein product [Brassicogethes aeneus]|uniref:Uncharacterized protein n=1 Tax=Brassicogethes aeneus TaxID=1431903 RepID=A0A9P0BEU8_BRAAE|nr:unnamed protein product [Brassicogethes aeneus]
MLGFHTNSKSSNYSSDMCTLQDGNSKVLFSSKKTPFVKCNYCSKEVVKNGTRMAQHLKKCYKCPNLVKQKYLKNVTDKENIEINVISSPASLLNYVDKIVPKTEQKATELLSRAIFASGCPFRLVESKYWQEFFKFIRPAFTVPSRHHISGDLLEKEYESVKSTVEEKIASTDSVGIMCDGWSNIRNESIINFVVTTPTPLLYKTLVTGKQPHTSEYLANQINNVIEKIGSQKVFGLVTDNAANMKAAWKILKNMNANTNLYMYGCFAHSLNLLFTDFRNLKTLKDFINEVVSIIKTIKQSHILLAAFKEKQNKNASILKLPIVTRWGSIVTSLESISINKHALQSLCIDDNIQGILQKHASFKNNILNENFWVNVQVFLEMLKPIATAIKFIEGDQPQMSSIVGIFKNLEEHVNKTDAIQAIFEASQKIPEIDENTILMELANYQAKEDFFKKDFLWLAVEKLSPIAWWKGFCKNTQISKLAVRFLSLPATSAACERSFSTYGSIHTAKKNRLTNEKAAKLVYISHNLRLTEVQLSTPIRETDIKELNNMDTSIPSTSKSLDALDVDSITPSTSKSLDAYKSDEKESSSSDDSSFSLHDTSSELDFESD